MLQCFKVFPGINKHKQSFWSEKPVNQFLFDVFASPIDSKDSKIDPETLKVQRKLQIRDSEIRDKVGRQIRDLPEGLLFGSKLKENKYEN